MTTRQIKFLTAVLQLEIALIKLERAMRNPLRFAYRVSGDAIQGYWLHVAFDRQISSRVLHGRGICNEQATPENQRVFNALRQVKGVIVSPDGGRYSSQESEHLGIDGNRVQAKLYRLTAAEIEQAAFDVAKAVQSVIAPGSLLVKVDAETLDKAVRALK